MVNDGGGKKGTDKIQMCVSAQVEKQKNDKKGVLSHLERTQFKLKL